MPKLLLTYGSLEFLTSSLSLDKVQGGRLQPSEDDALLGGHVTGLGLGFAMPQCCIRHPFKASLTNFSGRFSLPHIAFPNSHALLLCPPTDRPAHRPFTFSNTSHESMFSCYQHMALQRDTAGFSLGVGSCVRPNRYCNDSEVWEALSVLEYFNLGLLWPTFQLLYKRMNYQHLTIFNQSQY